MNVRCESFVIIGVTFLSFLAGCVKEDTDSCGTQGMHIYYYNKTVCRTDTVYPAEINEITLGVFDKEGKLISSLKSTNVALNRNYFQELEINSGLYTVIAWSGLSDQYLNMNDLQPGVTTKEDLLFRIKRSGISASSIAGKRIYCGESTAVYINQNRNSESQFDEVKINMQEITNRLTVSIEGLSSSENIEVGIESKNGSMNIDGSIAPDQSIEYDVTYSRRRTGLDAYVTVLKLETGYNTTLIIRNTELGTELFRGDLLGTLLLKNPEVNLACDHDFLIRFTAEDQCNCGEIIISEIWINEWLVHSYEKEM